MVDDTPESGPQNGVLRPWGFNVASRVFQVQPAWTVTVIASTSTCSTRSMRDRSIRTNGPASVT